MMGGQTKSFCAMAAFFLLIPMVVFAQLDTAWLRSIDGGARNEDIFSDMYVDDSGNVYVTGMTITSGIQSDIFVRKFSRDGAVLWSAVYDGRADEDDSASALVVDSTGNVYVCGWTIDTLADRDMVTLKLSNTGQLVWVRTWFRIFNGDDAAHSIALDRLGRVIVAGCCADSFNNIDYCTICYNAENGDTVWVRYYNRIPENDEDIAYSICVDDSNNTYVTGTSYDDDTDYDIVTIKYRPDGTRAWLRRKNNWPWRGDDYGRKVIFDPVTKTIILGGIVWDDNQDYNYFTMKYSRNVIPSGCEHTIAIRQTMKTFSLRLQLTSRAMFLLPEQVLMMLPIMTSRRFLTAIPAVCAGVIVTMPIVLKIVALI